MLKRRLKINSMTAISSVLAALIWACKIDPISNDKASIPASNSYASQFASVGSICGTYFYFLGYNDKSENDERPIVARASLGVCGNQNGGEWKALAVSQDATELAVKVDGETNRSRILINRDLDVMVKGPEGRLLTVGKLSERSYGAPIKLDGSVLLQVLVDGKPFSLEQNSKRSPGMSLLLSINRD